MTDANGTVCYGALCCTA